MSAFLVSLCRIGSTAPDSLYNRIILFGSLDISLLDLRNCMQFVKRYLGHNSSALEKYIYFCSPWISCPLVHNIGKVTKPYRGLVSNNCSFLKSYILRKDVDNAISSRPPNVFVETLRHDRLQTLMPFTVNPKARVTSENNASLAFRYKASLETNPSQVWKNLN